MKFFSVDSPIYKFMNRLFDIFKLNMMWLLCSIPIVTMGAATTAAYTITLKMIDEKEGYIAGPFWKEFKANLKKGSIMGIILLVGIYAIYLDIQLYQHAERNNTLFLIVAIAGIFLLVMHMIYAFPLLARYENSVINTLRNSYSIAAKFLGRTFFLLFLLLLEALVFDWNYATRFLNILVGPATMMLTVSGFAMQFFRIIERENEMKEVDDEDGDVEEAEQNEETEELTEETREEE